MTILRSHKLADERGASIVIALVFFLICAVIGSVVVTAATVNSKATATYKQSTQQELTMTSAARTLAEELQQGTSITWNHSGTTPKPEFKEGVSDFAKKFWEANGDAIWAKRNSGESYEAGVFKVELSSGASGGSAGAALDPVYASITVDRNFNFIVKLSFTEDANDVSPYDETVSIQAIPEFDISGKVKSLSWAEPVITTSNTGPKAKAAATGGV